MDRTFALITAEFTLPERISDLSEVREDVRKAYVERDGGYSLHEDYRQWQDQAMAKAEERDRQWANRCRAGAIVRLREACRAAGVQPEYLEGAAALVLDTWGGKLELDVSNETLPAYLVTSNGARTPVAVAVQTLAASDPETWRALCQPVSSRPSPMPGAVRRPDWAWPRPSLSSKRRPH